MPQPGPQHGNGRGLVWVPITVLTAHLALCAARIPGVVVGRRLADVAEYERKGAVRWFLDTEQRHGADAVEWIRTNVAGEAIVLYRGDSKGAIEFLPGLLAPRLLVAEGLCPGDATTHGGRPLARQAAEEGGGVLVIAARGDELRLERR